MNERIQELADQAYRLAYPNTSLYDDDNSMRGEIEFEKKFAELIVWDCIEAIDAKEYTMGGDTEAMGMRFSINIIKKHFGVEE